MATTTPKKTTTKKTSERKTSTPRKATAGKTPQSLSAMASAEEGTADELAGMAPAQQEAFVLSEAAISLDRARQSPDDRLGLAEALEKNLEVWTAVRAMVSHWSDHGQEQVKANILRLSDYITGSILKAGTDISEATLDTLINVNLQIAEGLLEGYRQQWVRDRAYYLWVDEGRPDGRNEDYWYRAVSDFDKQ